MTVKICDIKGKRDAETIEFNTEKTQINPASSRTEYISNSIDLCPEGAMLVLKRIVAIVSSQGELTRGSLANLLKGMKSESTRQ